MKNHAIWIGLLIGALLASLTFNVVQWRDVRASDADVDQLVESLELTDAQVHELTSCCGGCGCFDETAREELATAERELAMALTAGDVDAARIAELTASVAAQRRVMFESCVETILKVRGVLSPEQRATLESRCCEISR